MAQLRIPTIADFIHFPVGEVIDRILMMPTSK
jgi:hypothetical protein